MLKCDINRNRIVEGMEARGMDEKQLALALGVHLDEVLKCVHNMPSELDDRDMIFSLSKSLQLPPRFFLKQDYSDPVPEIMFIHARPSRTKKCAVCKKREATLLCDNYTGDVDTCDKPLCEECAIKIGGYKDYCPQCYKKRDLEMNIQKQITLF